MNKKNQSGVINKNHIDDDDFYYESDGQGQALTSMEKFVKNVLNEIGEDPARPGLVRTPQRVANAFKFLTRGYKQNIESIVNGAIFNECYSEIVLVKDIDFFSLCEHHLLPFYGKCHIAYIPNNKIIGLSKIPRIVEMFSRRLQVQERMTTQIGEVLYKILEPQGVAVVSEAKHLCMMMRGVEKQNSIATTSCMLGVFRSNAKTRSEFLKLISSRLS